MSPLWSLDWCRPPHRQTRVTAVVLDVRAGGRDQWCHLTMSDHNTKSKSEMAWAVFTAAAVPRHAIKVIVGMFIMPSVQTIYRLVT